MPTIGGEDVATVIVDTLSRYNEAVTEAVRDEVDRTAREMALSISSDSPSKTGRYSRSWKVKKADQGSLVQRIVYNKVPGLPHLLEHGHAGVNGHQVRGIPHIAVNAERHLDMMQRNIVEIIKNGG